MPMKQSNQYRKLFKFYLIPIIIIFQFSLNNNSYSQEYDKYKISLEYNYLSMRPDFSNMLGLNLEIFLNKKISLNYSLFLGLGDDKTYIHSHSGLFGAAYFVSSDLLDENRNGSLSDLTRLLAIILFFIPEGVNFYIPASKDLSLVPFFNPLGFDYISKEYTITTGVGMKLNYNISNSIDVSPELEMRYFYKNNRVAYLTGIGFGYRF